MKRKWLALSGGLLAIVLFGAACGSNSDTDASETSTTAAAEDEGSAKLRVAHIYSADSDPGPTVDVYASTGEIEAGVDSPAVSNLEYGTITDYLEVPAGTYNIGVYAAGTTDEVKTFEGVELADSAQITAIAERASTSSTDFSLGTVDEGSLEFDDAKANVTAYHGVPLDAANGVRIGAVGAGCLADGAQLNFQDDATVAVPGGTYQVGVFGPDDTTCSGTALIGPADLQVEDGSAYLAIAYGNDPSSLALLPAPIEEPTS